MVPIQETRVFKQAASLSDEIYHLVSKWSMLGQKTIGEQLVRAADSVGANLMEGDGRGSDADSIRYFRYSRSSAREAGYFLERAVARGLVDEVTGARLIGSMDEVTRMVSGLVTYRETHGLGRRVRETVIPYHVKGMTDYDPLLYPKNL